MKTTIILMLLHTSIHLSYSQAFPPLPTNTVNFTRFEYDINGNRISKKIEIFICGTVERSPIIVNGVPTNKKQIEGQALSIEKNAFILSPNPTTENANLSINTHLDLSEATMVVYNFEGKVIYRKSDLKDKSIESIPLVSLSSGTYMVILSINDKTQFTWKVIKH